jgi:hypothetical protein
VTIPDQSTQVDFVSLLPRIHSPVSMVAESIWMSVHPARSTLPSERMNSPLELREVRLRGLVRCGRGAARMHMAQVQPGSSNLQSTRAVSSRREMQGTQSTKVDFAPFQRRIHSLLDGGLAPIAADSISGPVPADASSFREAAR